jgi:FkbM family methyltransferase
MIFLSKEMHRRIRYNPIVERAWSSIKRSDRVDFPEIALSVSMGPGDIVIDCGANVGDVSSRFARTGATVHAFEPNPDCYKILLRRFRAMPNVKCYPFGVMDRKCKLSLQTPVVHAGFDAVEVTVAATFVAANSAVGQTSVDVECIDLAAFITDLKGPVKLIKIDIEGSEIQVINKLLDTGLNQLVDWMIVETHERLSEDLAATTSLLRNRVTAAGLADKIRLDWV